MIRQDEQTLVPAADASAPDVIDELIDAVFRRGGDAVIVPAGDLADLGRLAAVLRY